MDGKTVKIVRKGYTVVYDNKDDSIGFLGTYDGPGGSGYDSFTDLKPDYKHLTDDITVAMKWVENVKNMKNQYGSDKHDLETARVAYYIEQAVIEEIQNDHEVFQARLAENAMSKLTPEELEALITKISSEA